MSGGVLGKWERRGPTHTRLTVLWPPAPKNIVLNWQGREIHWSIEDQLESGQILFFLHYFQFNTDLVQPSAERR